jgi:hypothetical protein
MSSGEALDFVVKNIGCLDPAPVWPYPKKTFGLKIRP